MHTDKMNKLAIINIKKVRWNDDRNNKEWKTSRKTTTKKTNWVNAYRQPTHYSSLKDY